MAKYLTYKSTRLFLKLSKICYLTGSLSCSQFMERLALLRMMCSPKNPSGIYAERVLSREKIELNDVWFDDAKKIGVIESSEEFKSNNEPPLLYFCSAPHTAMSHWTFHKCDDDFFPSIPHGHLQGKSQPKLDSYNGRVYQKENEIRQESRDKIIKLWNDEKFREFATQSIQYYLDKHPTYKGWRVEKPLRLPRRRK